MQKEVVKPRIDESWLHVLQEEFQANYFRELKSFLKKEKEKHQVYPPGKDIFRAYNTTPFDQVKVVIIGQDPYHGPGQAHGLCFSVKDGVKPPPSLKNIFKELKNDLDIPLPKGGNLLPWANQGVLLLNATLTVRARQAGSHQQKGWEKFTDTSIKKVSDLKSGVVFLLWGRFAQNKATLIDQDKHYVFKAAHPSPFSAHNGFFGCNHFSKTNEILERNGKKKINWEIE